MTDKQQEQSFQKMNRRVSEEEEQMDESNRISRGSVQGLQKAKQKPVSYQHSQLMRDPVFRSAFTINERASKWFYNCFRCTDSQTSFVSVLDQQQKKHPAFLSEDMGRILKDKILKLKIIQSSRLQLDPNVMHPFVKVHVVDKNTGCYLNDFQSVGDEAIVYSKEQITFTNESKKIDTCANNYLLPFATNCCDFRSEGDSRGVWNEKFFINVKAEQILKPNTLFLFQILDFNHQALTYRDTDIYDKDNFYRVAWGFLRPVGIGKTHIGKTKLQLFKYKFRNKKAAPIFNSPYIPSIYYDFIWNNHEKYQGFLTVQLVPIDKPKYRLVDDDEFPKHIFQQEKKDRKYIDKFISAEDRRQVDEQPQIRQDLLKYYRNKNHCEVPKQIIYKLESARLGCFRVKFVGNYLFAACSDKHTTCVKLFNLQNGQKLMTYRGHRGIIYSLTTPSNPIQNKQKYLITTGSDHFTRIWKIPQTFPQYYDQQQSQQYLVGECLHTAAVYCAASIVINLKDIMYTVTCCYDGYVRLWKTYLGGEKAGGRGRVAEMVDDVNFNVVGGRIMTTSERIYPVCCTISPSNQIYVGDSTGYISIFSFQKDQLKHSQTVTHTQLQKDSILSIQCVERHLFVQSSDNMIRRFQLSGNKLHQDKKYAGGQYQGMLVNAKISPDFKYLLAPSESGKPVMWDVFTGLTIDIQYLNLNIKGPLTCCDWHPKYNLVVLSGFVEQCPIFVFGNVLTQAQMRIVLTN